MPLLGLLGALTALDSGTVVPMLRPSRANSRPPEPPFRKVRRAAVIHCLNILIDAGMKVDDACKFVAPLVRKAGMPTGGRPSTYDWKTLKGWRDDTTRRNPKDQEAHALAAFRVSFPNAPGTPLDQVKVMVKRALSVML